MPKSIFAKYNYVSLFILVFLFAQCKNSSLEYLKLNDQSSTLHESVDNLSDIIVHDIFSPPVASRIYAYSAIAAYECAIHVDSSYTSLSGQLTDLDSIPQPEENQDYSYPVAALQAYNTVGKALIFSEKKMETFEKLQAEALVEYDIPTKVKKRSIEYGNKVAAHILAWAAKDNYNQTRSFPKFSLNDEQQRWKPTPPGYFDGIEPHWKEIRPFVLKDADQFVPPPPTPYDTDEKSLFYKETMEVYEVVKNADDNQKEIASFWDCNPYVMNVTGHVMHASKKITPGGHWMGITTIACKQDSADFVLSSAAYCLTSIALADAFISCWDEKYRSNLIRPETVINENIDENWVPLLQTPPFPEYTSGHSVISTAAAITLTSLFGEAYAYTDDVEVKYGLPARKYKSFAAAADEAAISRLYGGIHYRPAIVHGVDQGEKVGNYIVEQLKLKK